MKLSTASLYGLRAMVYLAKKDKICSIAEISKAKKISADYLEKILSKLKKAKLLEVKRGSKGGYYLAKKPKEIQIKEIIKPLENQLSPVFCVSKKGKNKCPLRENCETKKIWQKLNDAMNKVLTSTKLSDLI